MTELNFAVISMSETYLELYAQFPLASSVFLRIYAFLANAFCFFLSILSYL